MYIYQPREVKYIGVLIMYDDHYLLLTLVNNGRQTNLPHGNFYELQMADLAVQK